MENKIVENNIDNIFDSIKDFKGIGSEAKLIRDVVDIRTWLEEDFYSGPSSHQIYPYWKDAIVKVFSSPTRINEVILGGSIGTGKGEPVSTLIPTPEGPVRLGDLKVGEFVFNEEGKPTKVTGVYDRGRLQTYKITFTDNSYLIVDGSHIWSMYNSKGELQDFVTEDLYNNQDKYLRKLKLPLTKPLEFNKKDLKIPPYILGALIANDTPDKKSKDKYIHEDYLYSSIEDRKELLYGLMDGDGSVRHADRGVANAFYSTTSKKLADNIVQLVTSLGGIVRRRDYKDYYSLTICTDFNPFKKSIWKEVMDESLKNRKKSNVNRKLKSIEIYGEDEIRCIKVDNPTSLYIGDTQFNIVTHNTTIACYMIAYRLYELSCYYPPQALYNLMNNSKILFAYFNINKELASQVGFSQIRDLIDSIPYFQNIFRRNEKINSVLEWSGSHIYMKSASSSNDVIGMNLISFFVDEANFFKGDGANSKGTSTNDAQSKARALYNSVRARGKSRFVVNNEDFTFNVLVSSSMYDSSFTAERIQDSIGDPHVMVFEPKIWEVKNVDTYSKERFVVFSGNELIDPVICNSVADVNYIRTHYKLKESKKKTPNEAIKDIKDYDVKKRFIEVPENFRKEFEGNIIQALQDIAGVPVSATGKLFSNRDCYARALTDEESPFLQDQIIISTGANTTIQDYFKEKWKPKDITKKRFIHFDQATTGDSYGAAQCYIDSITYDEFNLPKVNIKFDWMIRINPPKPPHKIDLAKVRSIIPWQEKNFGISYGMISYDSFQSAEAIQDLEKSGYPVRLNSVDRTDKDYLNLTELYYQGRIHHYRNEWYEKELFNLNWYRAQKKIDHPPVSEGGCLRGNTKIRLLNGTSVEIKDLLNKKEFWLYGSLSDGTIVPTKGRNCRVTRYVDKLFRITLDNGEVIEVTENHPFMLRDGSYKKADELTIGISLMPLYTKVNGNYELILNNKTGRWNFTHIYTYKWFNNDYDRFKVIHHYDINPRNNEPDNLRQLTRSEHMKIHKEILCRLSAEARKDNEEYIEKQRKAHYKVAYGRDYKVQDISFKDYKPFSPSDEDKYFRYKSKYLRKKERQIKSKYHGFSDYNLSEEARIKNKRNAIKLNTEYWNKPENKEWQKTVGKQNLRKALNIRLNKEDNIWLDKVKNSNIDYSNFSISDFMFEFGGSRNAVERRVLKLKGLYNHKISNIEVIYLDKPEPVYDITVDETSNFALSSGIFVHNSKDLSDAVCGSVANALDYPAIEETQRENDINYFLDDVDMDPNKFKSDVDILLGSFNNMY